MKSTHTQHTEACTRHKANMNIHKTHTHTFIYSHTDNIEVHLYTHKYNIHVHIITWDKIYI